MHYHNITGIGRCSLVLLIGCLSGWLHAGCIVVKISNSSAYQPYQHLGWKSGFLIENPTRQNNGKVSIYLSKELLIVRISRLDIGLCLTDIIISIIIEKSNICIRSEDQLFFLKIDWPAMHWLKFYFLLGYMKRQKYLLGQWCCSSCDASQRILWFDVLKLFYFIWWNSSVNCNQGF